MHKKSWTIFGLIVTFFGMFAWYYFDQAIPLVRVAITMDQKQAIEQSKLLALRNQIDIADYQVATRYKDSSELQAFVELEAGGKQAFIDMIEHDDFQPYHWQVRFFKEKDAREVFFSFTPSGKPYEFLIKLPESFAGPALSKDDALKVALDGADRWGTDLSNYALIEHHKEEILSGRVDHTFTYQREDKTIGAGFYRIELKVCGDDFAGIVRGVKIPDEFNRRYAQMYATNTMIAGFARNIAILLYLFVFVLFIFMFFVHRKDSFLYKNAYKVFAIFFVLLGLNVFNSFPLFWYEYQTQVSSFVFILQMVLGGMIGVTLFSLFVSLITLTAETAGRYVFGKHLQFFKLWTAPVVGSYQVLQQTLIGYGSAIIFFGYNVAFYMLASKLNCWIPLSTLIDPNILTSRMPSFSPLVTAFQAGFMEEFLCRCLPLAGIMLLALHAKHKKSLFWVGFVVQSLIFGALHASYPQQPAYYRIVELMVPSFGFGYLYLTFGLLPCIVSHFVYDAFFMSLPIFVSNLYFQQIFAVTIILLPLLVVLVAWIGQGYTLSSAPAHCYNQAYNFADDTQKQIEVIRPVGHSVTFHVKCAALLFACAGLIMLYCSNALEFTGSAITITLPQAESIARTQIAKHFKELGSEWKMSYTYIDPAESKGAKFIWQTYGTQMYKDLEGHAIVAPSYCVKFVKFEGPVEDRSEQFSVIVQADGSVLSMMHTFPQGWHGADLQEEQALHLAYEWINTIYGLHRQNLEVVVCKSVKHEHRRDWTIELKDINNFLLESGQVRIEINIAGDQLSCINRYVFVPETWAREEQNRLSKQSMINVFKIACLIIFCLLFVALVLKKFKISRQWFQPFVLLVISFLVIKYLLLFLNWSEVMYRFTTTESLSNQIFNTLSNFLVVTLAMAIAYAVSLLGVFGLSVQPKYKHLGTVWLFGFALAVGMVGVMSLWETVEPQMVPLIAQNQYSLSLAPSFYMFLHVLLCIAASVITLKSIFVVIARVAGAIRVPGVSLVLFLLAGLVLTSCCQLMNIFVWIGSGLSLGVLWYLIHKYFISQDDGLLWILVACLQLLRFFPSVWFVAYPGIVGQFVLCACLIFGSVSFLYRKL